MRNDYRDCSCRPETKILARVEQYDPNGCSNIKLIRGSASGRRNVAPSSAEGEQFLTRSASINFLRVNFALWK